MTNHDTYDRQILKCLQSIAKSLEKIAAKMPNDGNLTYIQPKEDEEEGETNV